MRKITWDTELAAKAQEWANKCKYEHSPKSFRPGVGENLYWTSVNGGNVGDIGRNAVELWACERKNVIGLTGIIPFKWKPNTNKVCQWTDGQIGHWTQLIWADTHKVISKL